jgi:hypothetical protein
MPTVALRRLALLAMALCCLAGPSWAQRVGEQLLAPIPPTFKLAAQPQYTGVTIKVYLPANETTQDWTEQITVQVFRDKGGGGDPMDALRTIEKTWLASCKESKPIHILAGKTNGYATASMLLLCPLIAAIGKPEAGMLHVIRGNDHFYLVQKNARYIPSHEQVTEMVRYMATVSLCDDRGADHPCPARR